jgi:hypothetical protein
MEITPDNKDWTWVLQEPCPECGMDTRAFERAQIPAMIISNARAWHDVLSGSEVRTRTTPGKWSPLEYACHVRDVLRIYDYRLNLMLTTDDPHYPNWDQNETAVAERYGEQETAVVDGELATAAETLASRFAGVHGDLWERTGNRSDGARFTVETFGRYFIHDPVHHLYDVTGIRHAN